MAQMAELQDKHDQEDERRREEIRALRSEVDQERGLRLAEVALYREELARARAVRLPALVFCSAVLGNLVT